ncbi:hypothetical protein ABC766_12940 [Methylobacterium fujisawaense]|uniref:hypothetical protein n=1 Tax=Methylobacterium fujisawaense TaxID=107400 RepID=UPI0031F4A15F
MAYWLNVASALAAIAAAGLWWASARVEVPSQFPITVYSMHTSMNQIIGEQVVSTGSSPEIDNLARAMIRQSQLSAWAAVAAGIAAALQGVALLLPSGAG